MKAEQAFPQQPFQLLDSDCKICYLSLDDRKHYPIIICSAQHIICEFCFIKMSKSKRFITCPFCKRNTEVEVAHRFKYGLTANQAYGELRTKYLELLDRLNRDSAQAKLSKGTRQEDALCNRFTIEYHHNLTELGSMVHSLKDRLKKSQEINADLSEEIEQVRQRYNAFEMQINDCKFNQLIIKNKLTMYEYQLKKLQKQRQREKSILSVEVDHLNRELYSHKVMLSQMAAKNEELLLENIALKNLNEIKAEANRHQIIECPEIGIPFLQENPIFLTPKKSKSVSTFKDEKEEFLAQKSQKRQRAKGCKTPMAKPKEEFLKVYEKKQQKMFKKKEKDVLKQ